MYKQASQLKLRFNTEKGMLTVEQLWDCSRAMLGRTIKGIHTHLKESESSDELEFLSATVTEVKDPENTLRFNILKDIYLTKKSEAETLQEAATIKLHNDKIDGIIARKQDEELEGMTLADLEKLRK